MTKFGFPPSISREPTSRFGGGTPRDTGSKVVGGATPRDTGSRVFGGVTPRDTGTRFGMPTLSKETVWRVGPPVVNNNNNNNSNKQCCQVRKNDKKIPIKGWEVRASPDDGIETWAKRQATLESKRGNIKKRPVALDSEYYISPNNRCSALDDAELFVKESLHHIVYLKEQHKHNSKNNPNRKGLLKYKYTQHTDGPGNTDNLGVITPVGFTKNTNGEDTENVNHWKHEIGTYRNHKVTGNSENQRRSKSVPENHPKNKEDQRSSNYYKIKQILRLSRFDSRSKTLSLDEEEDEGYSSKTSSAEAKEGIGTDSAETGNKLHRKFSSMVDLSELPSEKEKNKDDSEDSKIKFSYTHQNQTREPSIIRLPDNEIKLGIEKSDTNTRLTRENSEIMNVDHGGSDTPVVERGGNGNSGNIYTSYRKLKRQKEDAVMCVDSCISPWPTETTTVYSINNIKPVTLVLRKISIQNADENVSPNVSSIIPPLALSDQRQEARPSSRCESRTGSRIGTAASRIGSALSRSGSAMSGSSSARSCVSEPERLSSSRQSHRPSNRQLLGQAVRNVKVNKPKEAIWSPSLSHVSVLDRQESNCCLGDLIPAMDKSIYTNQLTRNKPYTCTVNTESHDKESAPSDIEQTDQPQAPSDDGYKLLKKGLDLLTGSLNQQPTLGPPPFRPNQSRHPLIQNVTIITDQGRPPQETYVHRYVPSPVHDGKLKGKVTPRTQSDKGSRQTHVLSEKATQRKLKEAFSKFYQNRPKDIGKEFRRMQTMWNG